MPLPLAYLVPSRLPSWGPILPLSVWFNDDGSTASSVSVVEEQQEFAAAVATQHQDRRRQWDAVRNAHRQRAAEAKAAVQRSWLRNAARWAH